MASGGARLDRTGQDNRDHCRMTRWVTWELKQVIASGKLNRPVLLQPPDTPAGSAARRRLIVEALSGSCWRAALEDITTPHTIALCQKLARMPN